MTDAATLSAAQDEGANGTPNRGVVLPRFGDASVLRVENIPFPQAEDDDVVVRVRAASVNPVDWKIRNGDFPPIGKGELPIVLGRDLAGEIENCGTAAHNMLSKGDRVFAHIGLDRGAQAEYVVVKANELVAMPSNLDFVAAGAVGLAAMTAWQGLFDHGGLKEGQRVLIHGGAGGVGMFAVQFARAKGATVLTTASGDDLDFVRGLGADTAIDYKEEKFEDIVTGVDVVLDLVGGETRDRSWGVLRQGGILVSTLDEPDQDKAVAMGVRAAKRWMAEPNAVELQEIADLIEAGKVRVEVAATFPLDQVSAAYDRQEKGHDRGKIVLTFD
jgi:NADPH:quinone reductase-like Zn-dependent oxidoreductase